MKFQFQHHDAWPTLAWVASGDLRDTEVLVQHGSNVCIRPDWFGEVVWDRPFEQAEFDQTDLVFGSGARKRNEGVTFVSASHTLDRLAWCVDGDRYWVSNSLAALLAVSETSIHPTYPHYPRDFTTIIGGISKYRRLLVGASRDVRLTYHDNLRLTASGLQVVPKPKPERDLSTYQRYRSFLLKTLEDCTENLRDRARATPFEMLGTISTGFDSPTVCGLGKRAGLEEAISITSSRGGKSDSGREIAEQLGIRSREVGREDWASQPLAEVPFIASDAKGEDVYFRGAESLLRHRVLLTGYAAGAWARREHPLTELRRADQSGLSLTEYRLWAGFIHLPVPTLGLRSGGDIFRVNLADDMKDWYRGRSYDKPFCRRLLVESGVDESLFGVEKKAASVLLFDRRSFLSQDSLNDFQAYLHDLGIRRRAAHLCRSRLRSTAAMFAVTTSRFVPGRFAKRAHQSLRLNESAYRDPRFDYLFGWAMRHAMKRYSTRLTRG